MGAVGDAERVLSYNSDPEVGRSDVLIYFSLYWACVGS
jgi:hypothetical protein